MNVFSYSNSDPLTEKELEELREAAKQPIVFDEDCPEFVLDCPENIAEYKKAIIRREERLKARNWVIS